MTNNNAAKGIRGSMAQSKRFAVVKTYMETPGGRNRLMSAARAIQAGERGDFTHNDADISDVATLLGAQLADEKAPGALRASK